MNVALLLVVALSTPADDGATAADAAKRASSEERYCDALTLFLEAFALSHEVKHLYNAAEVAYAADDRLKALELYRDVLARFPTYERAPKIEARIQELGRSMADGGVGSQCPASANACGNGRLEPGEQCDDGNVRNGDNCSSACTLPVCGNGRAEGAESCDDGNVADGDGCDHECHTERPAVVRAAHVSSGVRAPRWLAPTSAGVGVAGALGALAAAVPAFDVVINAHTLTDDAATFRTDAARRTDVTRSATVLHGRLAGDVAFWNGAGLTLAWLGGIVGVVGAGVAAGALVVGSDEDAP